MADDGLDKNLGRVSISLWTSPNPGADIIRTLKTLASGAAQKWRGVEETKNIKPSAT